MDKAQLFAQKKWASTQSKFITSLKKHKPDHLYSLSSDGILITNGKEVVFIWKEIINRFSIGLALRVSERCNISLISAFKRLNLLDISPIDGSISRTSRNQLILADAANFVIVNNKHLKGRGIFCRCLICGAERYINFLPLCRIATCEGCKKSSTYKIEKAKGCYTVNRFENNKELKSESTYLYWICFTSTCGNSYFKIGIDSTGYRWKKNIGEYHVVDILRLKTTKLIAFHIEQYIIKRYQVNRCEPIDVGADMSGKTEFFNDNMLLTDVEEVIKQCIYHMNAKALKHYDESVLIEKGLLDLPVGDLG